MHPIVESLIKQVPPPITRRPIDSWTEAENKLGLVLPDDYKSIIEIYGDYRWNNFLSLLDPFSDNRYLNLFTQLEMILDGERVTRKEWPEHYPLSLYPEPGGLLPFFITDNGDTGFWITQAPPDKWPILVKDARAPEFEVHFINTALFLLQFSGGRLKTQIFPVD